MQASQSRIRAHQQRTLHQSNERIKVLTKRSRIYREILNDTIGNKQFINKLMSTGMSYDDSISSILKDTLNRDHKAILNEIKTLKARVNLIKGMLS